jgi:hypothetical protein
MSQYLRQLFSILWRRKPGTASRLIQVVLAPQQHPPNDRSAWRTHWKAQKQPWRTEPEIDPQRQMELNQCRAIIPNIEKGIYPFKGMKLSRADVEWLLATHEDGRGPVNWSDESQREYEGLDLRVPCQVTRPLRHISLPEAMSSGNLVRENRLVALFFGSICQEDTIGNKMVVSSFCLLRIRTMSLQPCQVTPGVLHPSFPVTCSLSSLEGEDVSPNSSSVVVRCSVRASFSHIQEAM